jgi:hypothetical protein
VRALEAINWLRLRLSDEIEQALRHLHNDGFRRRQTFMRLPWNNLSWSRAALRKQ